MSAAAAVDATPVTPARTGKKKLILIGLVVLLVLALAGAGVGWWLWQRQQAAQAAEGAEGEDAAQIEEEQAPQRDPKAVPTFVALDTFTVNLADRNAERYAQIGITLELEDGKQVERIKAFMPAIRNNILLVLSEKTAAQMMDRDGKSLLAAEIRRAAVKPLGIDLPAPVADAASGAASQPAKRRPATSEGDEPVPVTAVHFSNFIIQ